MTKDFKVKIGRNDITVRHYHSDGEVIMYVNGQPVEQISHEEHENAVVCFENLRTVLTALEGVL
jgi:hypothetical protein